MDSQGSPDKKRRSSITRIASSIADAITGSTAGNAGKAISAAMSDAGDKDSLNENVNQDQKDERRSLSNYFLRRKTDGSYKSGNSGGSVVTSLSDLERIEKIMTYAQYANKSIVKYFGKNLEEFRREMQYSKEIILSELLT